MTEEEKKPAVKKEKPNEDPKRTKEVVTELNKLFTFDIINYIKKPWKLIGLNFLMGIVRGIGFFLGMTIIGTVIFAILISTFKKITQSNIPLISEWLAKIITMVQENLKMLK